jgi:hypothetical protein
MEEYLNEKNLVYRIGDYRAIRSRL